MELEQAKRISIVIVDDEPNIVQFLEIGLKNEGFEVFSANDGMSAVSLVKQHAPHLVILDIMMPGMDGFEVCKYLKSLRHMAIIMLTAKEEIEDRIKGLMTGADDYMIKPFSFEELLARIQARIRNQFPELMNEMVSGPFRIDDVQKEIRFQHRQLELSPTEYELLKYLILHPGTVLSKGRILENVWGYDFGGEVNIVEVYIRALREKLHDRDHRLIRTIRGAGYRMIWP